MPDRDDPLTVDEELLIEQMVVAKQTALRTERKAVMEMKAVEMQRYTETRKRIIEERKKLDSFMGKMVITEKNEKAYIMDTR